VGVAFGITILATVYGGDVDRFAPAFTVGALFGLLGMLVALRMHRGPAPQPAPPVTMALSPES
jgi:hypothetical protein